MTEELKTNLRGFLKSQNTQSLLDQYERTHNPPNRTRDFQAPQETKKVVGDSLPINNCSFNQFQKINSVLLNSWFLGYQEYSILSQNGVIQNIVQSISQDCVREWIEIKSISKNLLDKSDKIAKLNYAFESFKVREKIKNAMELTLLMGGCKIYPKIKGDDSIEGGSELLTSFDKKEKMSKGDLLYLKVIEPLYATPIKFNATNPLAEDYYVPTEWSILSTPIHSSRLCHFVYNYVPTLLKPVYWFNGYPLVQLCLDYLMGFETVRQNVVGVSGRYNINVLKTNMNSLLQNDSTFNLSLDDRLKIAQQLQSNFSIFALNNDPSSPEEWQQFNMTIAGLDGLLSQNAELVCSVSRIPAIKLFGTSPKGFNSTGENELRIYYDLIRSMQMNVIQPNLQNIFELIQIHTFGSLDEDLQLQFKPLWTDTALEKSQIQLNKMSLNIGYKSEGVLGSEEIRQSLNSDPESGYSGLAENFEESDEDELTDMESQNEKD